MNSNKQIPAGTKWGDIVGYSRATRSGNTIEVSGTAAVNEKGDVVSIGDPYEQTRFILTKIKKVIEDLGGSITDVVRTRIFVTDISRWEEVGRAHGEFFGRVKPATSMVEVRALITPDMMVEIEATAIISRQ
jgi:enamine deaminase RidA (YjgF/YER057c/UK114 family)